MGRRGFLGRAAAALGVWLVAPVRRLFAGESETPPGVREVVVVGGGYAGVAAATLLAAEDYDVLLLEREPQVGGRARGGLHNGWHFPRGVEYIGRPSGTVRWLFKQAGLTPVAVSEPAGAYWRDGAVHFGGRSLRRLLPEDAPQRLAALGRALRPLAEAVHDDPWEPDDDALPFDRRSLAALFEEHRTPAVIREVIAGQMRGIFGAGPEELSALYAAPEAYFELPDLDADATTDESDPDDMIYTLPETLGALPARLAERLGDGCLRGAHVTSVRWGPDDETFTVAYRRGGEEHSVRARAVVLAVPASVALELGGEVLPRAARSALGRVRYASYVTANLFSEGPLMTSAWDLSCHGTVFTDLYDTTRVEARARGVSDGARPGILGVYMPEAAGADHTLCDLDEQALLSRIFADLQRVLGRDVRGEVTGHDIVRFRSAFPIFRPGYHSDVLAPLARGGGPPIFLAGDYACYATVEGAVASGRVAAERLDESW
jgi:protoporphyrinogen oxidase